jgi:hypothetical protein
MNRKTDNELLDDVLAEAAPANFREALLDQTLRVVRRCRQIRRTRNVCGILVILCLLGIFAWQKALKKPSVAIVPQGPRLAKKAYTLISTQPLPAGSIITTRLLASGMFETSTAAVEVVETAPGQFRLINDQQLLALVASHSAALVRTGPNSEQLVFANPDDAKGFPLN